jgi:hypothetical protein
MVPAGNESANASQEISIVLNWYDELKRLAPPR